MSSHRAETMAVHECQKGNVTPLFQILAERLQSPRFAVTICMSLARGKPNKATKRERIGCHVDAMLKKRPGPQKEIFYAMAEHFNLSKDTVENYYADWRKNTKSVRRELDKAIEADE